MILWSSIGIIRESLNILLEGTPRGMDLDRIAECICSIPGVNSVHDLHVWSIGSDTHSLSCHVGIDDMRASESEAILRRFARQLEAALPHPPHHHPVRARCLRGGPWLRDSRQPGAQEHGHSHEH